MKKVRSHRNFGYGTKMAWAGKQALRDRYGNGHYGTVAGHAERCSQVDCLRLYISTNYRGARCGVCVVCGTVHNAA